MAFKNRQAVIDFIEKGYFASAMRADFDGILNCFCEDVEVLIRHGDNPVRVFSKYPSGEESHLKEFYTHLSGTFEAWFGDYKHFVDLDENRCASYFTVRLTPKSPDMLAEVGVQELQNCNFFRFEDGLIKHMIIYYSNSAAEAGSRAPTGYPK